MATIAENLDAVHHTIESACTRAGRDPDKLTMVVVTKSADFDAVRQVLALGYDQLGENRVQQLKKVAAQVDELHSQNTQNSDKPAVHWHMIGHLQRNKVRQVLPLVRMIHSVDTLRLAEEINETAEKMDLCPRVLMQVNASQEPQKYGVPVGAAVHLAEQIETLPHLRLAGLMTMAPLTHNQDVIRTCFSRTRELFLEIKGERIVGSNFTELSMGMSSDYPIAIEEGATILRIGSAVFQA